jgi:hypothetical protein
MTNPVNDYDLKNNFPALGRKIVLLYYLIDSAKKKCEEYRAQQARIISNALDNGYYQKEIDEKKGSWTLMQGDEKWIEEQMEKMGL